MIIGSAEISLEDIEVHSMSSSKLIEYSDSLVPNEFKHCRAIIDNQRYYCCLLLRRSKKYDWKKKNEVIEEIMKDIKVIGSATDITPITQIYSLVDMDVVNEYLERGV